MGIDYVSATKNDLLYAQVQRQQIGMTTGYIGQLSAKTKNGKPCFSWKWFRESLWTQEFQTELEFAVCFALNEYCGSSTQDKCVVKATSDKYVYFLECLPDEEALYCYSYRRDWLEQYMKAAEKGIRFITPEYNFLFRIEDGESIRIVKKDGSQEKKECRFIDDYHVEVGGYLYHICEFAERMEEHGYAVEPASYENEDNVSVLFNLLLVKISAEMKKYFFWLYSLPPEEIVQNAHECSVRQDIDFMLSLMSGEDFTKEDLIPLLESETPLTDLVRRYEKLNAEQTNLREFIKSAVQAPC